MNYWKIEVEKTNRETDRATQRMTLLLGSERSNLDSNEATSLVMAALKSTDLDPKEVWVRCHEFFAINPPPKVPEDRPAYRQNDVDIWHCA